METEKQLADQLEEKLQSFHKLMNGTGLSFDTEGVIQNLKNGLPYRDALLFLMKKATDLDWIAGRHDWNDRETIREGAMLLYGAIEIVIALRRQIHFDRRF